MRVRVQPYKAASKGARELSRALGVKRVLVTRTTFRPRRGDKVINWGAAKQLFSDDHYINLPCAVALAQDKLTTYAILKDAGVPIPEYTQEMRVAYDWLEEGRTVVARKLLRATKGRGIVLVEPLHSDLLPTAPLYTVYEKKRDEYRIHVAGGRVIDVQHKRRERTFEGRNNQIRNRANGWVFCRHDIAAPPECVLRAAIDAVHALGLSFGAADIGYNMHYDKACVYEVNTAPGLEGTTLQRYTDYFKEMLQL